MAQKVILFEINQVAYRSKRSFPLTEKLRKLLDDKDNPDRRSFLDSIKKYYDIDTLYILGDGRLHLCEEVKEATLHLGNEEKKLSVKNKKKKKKT